MTPRTSSGSATPCDAALLRLGEAPSAYAPLSRGERLVESDRFVLFLGSADHADANCVQRLRIAPADFVDTVHEVRSIARNHGCKALTWEVVTRSRRAVEPSLVDSLLGIGMRPARASAASIMGIGAPGPSASAHVAVDAVRTLEDFKAHVGVTHAVFDALDRLPAEIQRIDQEGQADLDQGTFVRYNARIDGMIVGAATATFTPDGVMLHTGSTLRAFRGLGVYRSLVARRWSDAVARGTPALVTRAGPMSAPILASLGFTRIGQIAFFVDAM